ncbi:MAG: dihydrolipoyl dehydrogenase, partial [Myxococcales bacterium]|nr:dihydrolipoyl dehydrogenase [Myxococcales bacterium]
MREIIETDVAIIGAGSAGLPARREAEKAGARTVLIEGGPFGTTCARVGCMPSKLLIAAADAAHHIRHAPQFGVHGGEVRVDAPAVFDRVRRERDRFAGFVVEATEAIEPGQRIQGWAKLVEPTVLEVGEDGPIVKAKSVVIATGSSLWLPPPLRGVRDALLDNEKVFELDAVPETLAVVGAGVIGLELGQALARLGSKVTVFSFDDQLGPITDPVVRGAIHEAFAAQFELALDTEVTGAEVVEGGIALSWRRRDGSAQGQQVFAQVLAATGRRPNLSGLDLARFGATSDRLGVPAHDPMTMQVGDLPVFIAGDVTNDRPLLHEASDGGRIAGINAGRVALGKPARAFERRVPLSVVFTDPQMGMVGESHRALTAAGVDFAVGEVSFKNQGRARVMGRNLGHARIYAERRQGRILGAELFGPGVEHMSHLLAWAVGADMT